jgi:hypothetical protein
MTSLIPWSRAKFTAAAMSAALWAATARVLWRAS